MFGPYLIVYFHLCFERITYSQREALSHLLVSLIAQENEFVSGCVSHARQDSLRILTYGGNLQCLPECVLSVIFRFLGLSTHSSRLSGSPDHWLTKQSAAISKVCRSRVSRIILFLGSIGSVVMGSLGC